ncbi:YdcF family protein [Mycolicibacterium phlei]
MALEAFTVVLAVVVVDMTIAGYLLLTNAAVDELEPADAILVLAGEHDGREEYGIELARQGWAPTVVLSDPYREDDAVMNRVCPGRNDTNAELRRDNEADVEVVCMVPDLLTTRGEAIAMRQLADERSWTKIMVVTWRYHLPRARFVFRQCFSERPDATVMVAVPRTYDFSVPEWELTYAYQFAGFAKAAILGDCV